MTRPSDQPDTRPDDLGSTRPDDLASDLYYLYLSNTPTEPVRRATARAYSAARVLELVYTRFPSARVYKIGLVTDVQHEDRDIDA